MFADFNIDIEILFYTDNFSEDRIMKFDFEKDKTHNNAPAFTFYGYNSLDARLLNMFGIDPFIIIDTGEEIPPDTIYFFSDNTNFSDS